MKKTKTIIGKTLRWLLLNFSLYSILKIFIYYTKKRLNLLNYKKEFIVKFKFNEKIIKFKLRENNDDFAVLREIFLFKAYEIPHKENLINIFDVGSHIGTSTVFFGVVNPKVKIWCLEPDINSIKILLFNLAVNNINASILNLALGEKKELKRFKIDEKNPAYSKIDKKGENITLTQSLDNLIDFLNLKRIDLVKMDIEGSEIKVLKGLKRNNKKIKKIICEIHHSEYKESELIELFKLKGFKVLPPLPHWKNLNNNVKYPFMIAINKDGNHKIK